MVTHQGCPQTPGRRRGPRTGDVSVSGLAGMTDGNSLPDTGQP